MVHPPGGISRAVAFTPRSIPREAPRAHHGGREQEEAQVPAASPQHVSSLSIWSHSMAQASSASPCSFSCWSSWSWSGVQGMAEGEPSPRRVPMSLQCRANPVSLSASLGLMQTGRSAFQCLQKFQQHNKALKRREWTEEEDRMLTQLVQQMRVGSHVPYRRSKCAGWCRVGGSLARVCTSCLSETLPLGHLEPLLCPVVCCVEAASQPHTPDCPEWSPADLSVPSCLLHGREGLHAADLPVDQKLGS